MLDEQDYNSLVETAYLLRSPKNAKRLIEARNRSEIDAIEYSELIESPTQPSRKT
jgi:antitoxin YefM